MRKVLQRATVTAPLCLAAIAAALAGCSFPGPQSPEQRAALEGCRADADRVYNVQNRYQLSERDSRDTPFSGSGQPTSPSDGLADEYSHENRVDACLHNGGGSPEYPSPPTTAPASAPASAAAHTP